LLKLSRETIERCQKTEYALVSSLQRDPVLADRLGALKYAKDLGCAKSRATTIELVPLSSTH
jgi:hypothetical protein